jgi:predicted RNA-binding Zn-ribbon protein involved in translation (DUF1610 family)
MRLMESEIELPSDQSKVCILCDPKEFAGTPMHRSKSLVKFSCPKCGNYVMADSVMISLLSEDCSSEYRDSLSRLTKRISDSGRTIKIFTIEEADINIQVEREYEDSVAKGKPPAE